MGVLPHLSVVRRRDEAQHGEYRTARVILGVYDRMDEAARTGVPYATLLDPPPADLGSLTRLVKRGARPSKRCRRVCLRMIRCRNRYRRPPV